MRVQVASPVTRHAVAVCEVRESLLEHRTERERQERTAGVKQGNPQDDLEHLTDGTAATEYPDNIMDGYELRRQRLGLSPRKPMPEVTSNGTFWDGATLVLCLVAFAFAAGVFVGVFWATGRVTV